MTSGARRLSLSRSEPLERPLVEAFRRASAAVTPRYTSPSPPSPFATAARPPIYNRCRRCGQRCRLLGTAAQLRWWLSLQMTSWWSATAVTRELSSDSSVAVVRSNVPAPTTSSSLARAAHIDASAALPTLFLIPQTRSFYFDLPAKSIVAPGMSFRVLLQRWVLVVWRPCGCQLTTGRKCRARPNESGGCVLDVGA